MVYSRAERVFILEHYFASKSLAAVREAFSNAYPDKEVPNNAPTGNKICDRKHVRRRTLSTGETPVFFLWISQGKCLFEQPTKFGGTETILKRLLPTLIQKHFAKSHKTHYKGWMLIFEKAVGTFSTCSKVVL
jgi:hypothetical protein